MGFPFGLMTTRPEGPETGANQPVSENRWFSLDAHSDFWEARSCTNEIPGFVPDSTARHWRALLFLGFVSPQKLIDGRTNQFVRRRSVSENLVPFKDTGATPRGVVRLYKALRGSFDLRISSPATVE